MPVQRRQTRGQRVEPSGSRCSRTWRRDRAIRRRPPPPFPPPHSMTLALPSPPPSRRRTCVVLSACIALPSGAMASRTRALDEAGPCQGQSAKSGSTQDHLPAVDLNNTVDAAQQRGLGKLLAIQPTCGGGSACHHTPSRIMRGILCSDKLSGNDEPAVNFAWPTLQSQTDLTTFQIRLDSGLLQVELVSQLRLVSPL
ncbi:hypothetical protein S40288_11288 [Stachybotrys chartarum IBT 40288]|nr:hypothetical protein S40288_11288 [Stachybotrys chartarum IBT 40288]